MSWQLFPGDMLSKTDLTQKQAVPETVDSNFVVLSGKCQNTKRPYLLKYKKLLASFLLAGSPTRAYTIEGAYVVGETYRELSGESPGNRQISTGELIGSINCPCCGNACSVAVCHCRGIDCIGDAGVNTCPWCGNTGYYTVSEEGFDINKKQE